MRPNILRFTPAAVAFAIPYFFGFAAIAGELRCQTTHDGGQFALKSPFFTYRLDTYAPGLCAGHGKTG